MRTTYAVTWRSNGSGLCSGKAELRARALHLDAVGQHVELRYDDLTGISIARKPDERIAGRPTLVLGRRDHPPIRLASVAQLGIISELAERLTSLHLGQVLARNRIVVVVPLRDGVQGEVRRLLEIGPPFDPESAGLQQHQVFVTDHEVVFIFDTSDEDALQRALADPNVWAAASAWAEYADGPARMGDEVFSWAKTSGDGYTR